MSKLKETEAKIKPMERTQEQDKEEIGKLKKAMMEMERAMKEMERMMEEMRLENRRAMNIGEEINQEHEG